MAKIGMAEGRLERRGNLPALRAIRLSKALSQRDLAERAGVTQKTIVDLELGRQEPRLRTIRLLAEALGVQPHDIDEFREAIEEKAAA
jgi:transcriptional regulator with XRE-family HTH domain